MNAFGITCTARSIVVMVPMLYVLLCHPGALNWSERFGLVLLSASIFSSSAWRMSWRRLIICISWYGGWA